MKNENKIEGIKSVEVKTIQDSELQPHAEVGNIYTVPRSFIHHPAVMEMQEKIKTKLPLIHTLAERIDELNEMLKITEDRRLHNYIPEVIKNLKFLGPEAYRDRIEFLAKLNDSHRQLSSNHPAPSELSTSELQLLYKSKLGDSNSRENRIKEINNIMFNYPSDSVEAVFGRSLLKVLDEMSDDDFNEVMDLRNKLKTKLPFGHTKKDRISELEGIVMLEDKTSDLAIGAKAMINNLIENLTEKEYQKILSE